VHSSRLDKIINAIELTAAGFLAVVTANVFVAVILRYFFATGLPDSYDFGRLFLGILIFWGIAVANYRGDHITVDLAWSVCGPRLKRAMDIFAGLVSLGAMAVLTWMVGGKVISTYYDNVQTFDLNLPVWMFYLIAWIGIATSIVLLVTRTTRLFLRGADPAAAPRHMVE
jgi:TRAP-type C4-dicarboxylate transport system permease small subunit